MNWRNGEDTMEAKNTLFIVDCSNPTSLETVPIIERLNGRKVYFDMMTGEGG
jgi:hypothetical protein